MVSEARTLFDKIWDLHLIAQPAPKGEALLYVDWNLVHEGPFYAFDGLKQSGRKLRRPLQTLAFADHYVPTTQRELGSSLRTAQEVPIMPPQSCTTKLIFPVGAI